ncbi:MAG TPA: hypothetical protein PKL06_01735 [Chitinophagales bacterium]|nr:hypothetical protein [Chitinophagales bacterium]
MKRYLFVIFCAIALSSCRKDTSADSIQENPNLRIGGVEAKQELNCKFDTVFSNGYFIQYHYREKERSFEMVYGNSTFSNGTGYYYDCMDKYPLHNNRFRVECVNNDFIVMSRPNGQSTKLGLILPLNPSFKSYELSDFIAVDSATNCLLYLPADDDTSTIRALNLKNGAYNELPFLTSCVMYPSECINSVKFGDNWVQIICSSTSNLDSLTRELVMQIPM